MCFTPAISLTTAIIEFVLGFIILYAFRRTVITVFAVALIFLLGFYQFTEFMICTSVNPLTWATLGFIAYTIMPGIWLFAALQLKRPNFNTWLVFIPTAFFVFLPAFTKEFITSGVCTSYFVIVKNSLFASNSFILYLYVLYYFGYFLYGALLVELMHRKEKKPVMRKIYLAGVILAFIAIIPPIFLFAIIPAFGQSFPSIYCEFALLYAIGAFVLAAVDHKCKISKRILITRKK